MSQLDEQLDRPVNEDKTEDVKILQRLGELKSEYNSLALREAFRSAKMKDDVDDDMLTTMTAANRKSVNEIFGDEIIMRAPDKMVDLLQGFIMVAYRDAIIYVNVNPYGILDENKLPANAKDNSFYEVDLK